MSLVAVMCRAVRAHVGSSGDARAMRVPQAMALFGLVWLLRMRGADCGCAACRRERRARQPSQRGDDCSGTPGSALDLASDCTPQILAQADAEVRHVAQVCVSAAADVECEAGATAVNYDCVVTHDVTVQTDFEDDECYPYEACGTTNYGEY